MSDKKYFPTLLVEFHGGIRTDFRLRMAVDLMKHVGIATATSDGEDSAGRQQLKLLPPQEVVDRCFEIARLTMQKAETLGWIEPIEMTNEEAAVLDGHLLGIKREAEFDKSLKIAAEQRAVNLQKKLTPA